MPFYFMLLGDDFPFILTGKASQEHRTALDPVGALLSATVKIGPDAAGTSYRLPESCVPMCIPSLTPHYKPAIVGICSYSYL